MLHPHHVRNQSWWTLAIHRHVVRTHNAIMVNAVVFWIIQEIHTKDVVQSVLSAQIVTEIELVSETNV
jgi:hypothetical protein